MGKYNCSNPSHGTLVDGDFVVGGLVVAAVVVGTIVDEAVDGIGVIEGTDVVGAGKTRKGLW